MGLRTSDPLNFNHPLNVGKVLHLRTLPWLMGGPTWNDISPSRNNGTMTLMAGVANGGFSPFAPPGGYGSLQFNGGTSINAGHIVTPAVIPTGAVSAMFSCWFNQSAFESGYTSAYILGNTSSYSLSVSLYSTERIQLAVGGAGQVCATAVSSYAFNTWVHLLAVSYATGGGSIYLNGLQAATGATSYSNPAVVNCLGFNSGSAFVGFMDDICVWDYAVPAAQAAGFAAALYQASSAGYPAGTGVFNYNRDDEDLILITASSSTAPANDFAPSNFAPSNFVISNFLGGVH